MRNVGRVLRRHVGRGAAGAQLLGGGGDPIPVQLLDFDGAAASFARNNGLGSNGDASYRTGAASFGDAATDALRTETLGGVGRYLFERERSSLVVRSDDWSTGWVKSNATTTAGAAGPKGDTSATQCDFTSNANAQLAQTIAGSATSDNARVRIGAWLRGAVGGEQLRFGCLRRNGTYDLATITLTTEWAWYTREVDLLAGAGNTQWALFNSNPGVAKTFYIQRASKVLERYPSSPRLIVGSLLPRYADSLLFPPDEVPLALREAAWSVSVRPLWAAADLQVGEKRVLCSTGAGDWIGFEEDSGSVRLRCYTGGALRFETSALTVARDTDYPVVVDMAAGRFTFNGTLHAAGTSAALPAGQPLRWGGIAGGADELDAGTSEPWTVV